MKKLFFCCFLFISFVARADYLVTNRTCNLKETNLTGSATIMHLNAGDTLLLFDEPQVNGYYHVTVLSNGQEGWVYRTFVRRFIGTPPQGISHSPGSITSAKVEIRVVDVGAGLCNLIKLPNNKFIIYDAGGRATSNGNSTIAQIKDYIPAGSEIELLVLSHTDGDHIVAAEQVVREYRIKKVLWSGFERSMVSNDAPTTAYNRLVAALRDKPSTQNINLNERDSTITPGNKLIVGNVTITFLCGFGKPETSWGLTDRGEKLNSVSIVMKLQFGNNSVLFCGDAVGRHRDDTDENALIATEKFLVDKASQLLSSTILIAPHHGANNGSSKAFVDLVRPKVVIFSSGHDFHHPTDRTARRYLNSVDISRIFRTDRGDDEGTGEWTHMRVTGCRDDFDDDDIQIELRSDGTYRVFYLYPEGSCNNN